MEKVPGHVLVVNEKSPPSFGNPEQRAHNAAERTKRRVALSRSSPSSGDKIVLWRVSWRRDGWLSQQSRLFRMRCSADSLFAKLIDNDRGEYRDIQFVRLDALHARDPRWVTVEYEVTP